MTRVLTYTELKARAIYTEFGHKPGSTQIASEFAIGQLLRFLWSQWSQWLHRPQRILEVGAGIGTLSWVVTEYLTLLPGWAEAVSVENNPWCQEQWAVNLSGWLTRPMLFDKVPAYEFYDLVILDGDQMPDDGWTCLAPEATVFVEGNRRAQRARLRQYLRNVGRPFCETPWRPPNRSKGIWIIRCEPTRRERVTFRVNRIMQWLRDGPARLQGQPIGKPRR